MPQTGDRGIDTATGRVMIWDEGTNAFIPDPATPLAPPGAEYIVCEAHSDLENGRVYGTQILMSGTLAERPAAGFVGRTYYVTDVGDERITRDTGAAWVDGGPDWDYIRAKPSTYAPSVHGHAISEVTGLQTSLDAKLEVGALATVWPVGSVFLSVVSTSPATLLGFGTWSQIAGGRFLVGQTSGDTDFDVAEETGGAKTHTLTTPEIPAHTHVQDSHTHTQNSHNHTQDSHNHTQNSFAPRILNSGTAGTVGVQGASAASNANASNAATTATNQAATATNQAATAVNQNATPTNQNAGGGGAHNNVPPYLVIFVWKRTA